MARAPGLALVVVLVAAVPACRCEREPALFGEAVRVHGPADEDLAQSEPAAFLDKRGHGLVVWMDFRDGQIEPLLYYARTGDGGRRFHPEQRLFHSDGYDRGQANPSIARTDDGTLHVVFLACRTDREAPQQRACDVWLRSSPDGGRTWRDAVPLARRSGLGADRPWATADGDRLLVSWNEERARGPSRWVLTEVHPDAPGGPAIRPLASLEDRKSYNPVAVAERSIHALLLDGSSPPGTLALAHTRWTDGNASTVRRVELPAAAVLVELAVGALDVTSSETLLVYPVGDGRASRLELVHDIDGTTRRFRLGLRGGRVTLPWVRRRPGGGFALAWLQERRGSWSVRAACVTETGATKAMPVSQAPFRFDLASRQRYIGDFLDLAMAGDRMWVVWSDTRAGNADVYAALGRCP